ncbi:MAG: hypothetical protein KGI57_00540 [Hyphomicrobiales bacterium]|nr:hypothetical protein [Hyphomicrobiales bacterium]MDE2016172.1 hypothetical protein [Hyphomicrobiales bacterium]
MGFGLRARLCAAALSAGVLAASGAALAHSWDEKVFSSHVDFAAVAAKGEAAIPALIERGRQLFKAKFTEADGAGRPLATQAIVPTLRKHGRNPAFTRTSGPDSSACASCHNEPVQGGAGDFVANVFVSEGFESAEFDSIDPSFSNERHTPPVLGDGLLELLGREMTADLRAERDAAIAKAWATGKDVSADLVTKGVRFGSVVAHPDGALDVSRVEGVDPDLTVRPFSRKGVFGSIRQFTINALNVHHGMEASERFGVRWTGSHDFDGSGVPDAVTPGDVSALVAWQATTPPPIERADLPADWEAAAKAGSKAFEAIGCSSCHMKTLPLKSMVFVDPSPYETAGTLRLSDVKEPIRIDLAKQPFAKTLKRDAQGDWLIPLFSDMKRHVMVDPLVNSLGNELMAQRFVARDTFLTPRLWGVGSTAPYGHRGDFRTLDAIIKAHGGESRFARDAYLSLPEDGRQDVIAYLRSLQIPEK